PYHQTCGYSSKDGSGEMHADVLCPGPYCAKAQYASRVRPALATSAPVCASLEKQLLRNSRQQSTPRTHTDQPWLWLESTPCCYTCARCGSSTRLGHSNQ